MEGIQHSFKDALNTFLSTVTSAQKLLLAERPPKTPQKNNNRVSAGSYTFFFLHRVDVKHVGSYVNLVDLLDLRNKIVNILNFTGDKIVYYSLLFVPVNTSVFTTQ